MWGDDRFRNRICDPKIALQAASKATYLYKVLQPCSTKQPLNFQRSSTMALKESSRWVRLKMHEHAVYLHIHGKISNGESMGISDDIDDQPGPNQWMSWVFSMVFPWDKPRSSWPSEAAGDDLAAAYGDQVWWFSGTNHWGWGKWPWIYHGWGYLISINQLFWGCQGFDSPND